VQKAIESSGMTQASIRTGIYLHYKNLRYEVLGCVRHSETLEWLVLYKALYGEQGLWVRPLAMFTEQVVLDGVEQPRFKLIEMK
jgi:hypothetical protein